MKKVGKIKTLTIASLSALALAAAPLALAQSTTANPDSQQVTRGERHGHGEGWGGRGGRGHGMMLKGINLTDDQKAKLKQIGQSYHERTQALHQELRAKRQGLHQATEGGTFNEALATQVLTETAGLQAKLMGEHFKMRQEMLSVLTPEQKTQLEQKRAEFKARWAGRGERKVQ
jgi:protein CpxP